VNPLQFKEMLQIVDLVSVTEKSRCKTASVFLSAVHVSIRSSTNKNASKILYSESGEALAQVAQRRCGCHSLEGWWTGL